MSNTYITEKITKASPISPVTNQAKAVHLQKGQIPSVGECMSADATVEADESITLEISKEGRQKQHEIQQMQMYAKQMKKERETAEENGDELGKIMTIFRRIANGDIVPWKDEKKLMEHSSEMYQAAKNIASMKENEDPKKYKSVDENEKQKNGQAIDADDAVEALVNSAGNSAESSSGEVNNPTEVVDII